MHNLANFTNKIMTVTGKVQENSGQEVHMSRQPNADHHFFIKVKTDSTTQTLHSRCRWSPKSRPDHTQHPPLTWSHTTPTPDLITHNTHPWPDHTTPTPDLITYNTHPWPDHTQHPPQTWSPTTPTPDLFKYNTHPWPDHTQHPSLTWSHNTHPWPDHTTPTPDLITHNTPPWPDHTTPTPDLITYNTHPWHDHTNTHPWPDHIQHPPLTWSHTTPTPDLITHNTHPRHDHTQHPPQTWSHNTHPWPDHTQHPPLTWSHNTHPWPDHIQHPPLTWSHTTPTPDLITYNTHPWHDHTNTHPRPDYIQHPPLTWSHKHPPQTWSHTTPTPDLITHNTHPRPDHPQHPPQTWSHTTPTPDSVFFLLTMTITITSTMSKPPMIMNTFSRTDETSSGTNSSLCSIVACLSSTTALCKHQLEKKICITCPCSSSVLSSSFFYVAMSVVKLSTVVTILRKILKTFAKFGFQGLVKHTGSTEAERPPSSRVGAAARAANTIVGPSTVRSLFSCLKVYCKNTCN